MSSFKLSHTLSRVAAATTAVFAPVVAFAQETAPAATEAAAAAPVPDKADTVFMSLSAIVDDAVYHQSPETIEVKRAMFESASKRILLSDHTKFERRALHRFVGLEEFDTVIVDDDTPIEHLSRLRSRGINVVVADPANGSAPGA